MSEEINQPMEGMNQENSPTPESQILPQMNSATQVLAAPSPQESKPAWRLLVAPAWFLLGVLVGLGVFYGLTLYTAKPAPPPSPRSTKRR